MIDEICQPTNAFVPPMSMKVALARFTTSRALIMICVESFVCPPSIPKQTMSLFLFFVCYSSQLRRLFSWMKKNLKSVALNVDFLFTIIATRKKRMKEKHIFFNETFSFSPIDGKTVFHLFFRKVFRSCVRRKKFAGCFQAIEKIWINRNPKERLAC